MKKILLALLSSVLLITVTQPAQAEDQKVLAIIDTAIDSTKFNSITYEVCFTTVKSSNPLENMSCPNGELFMEGKGSASAPWPLSVNNKTYHGDAMVKSALATNSNLKIVFIRVADVTSLGNSSVSPNGSTIFKAIQWVNDNASKYSIDAISISQSGINTQTKSLHIGCTTPSIFNPFVSLVSSLNTNNIPTFVATGNDGLKTIVGFPACITGVVGVGALSPQVDSGVKLGETATNRGNGLDVVANAALKITNYKGSSFTTSGSSVATAVAATNYVTKGMYSSGDQYISILQKDLVKFVDSIDKTKTPALIVWEPNRTLPVA